MERIGKDIMARLSQEQEESKLINMAKMLIFGVDTQVAVSVWNQWAM